MFPIATFILAGELLELKDRSRLTQFPAATTTSAASKPNPVDEWPIVATKLGKIDCTMLSPRFDAIQACYLSSNQAAI